MQTRANLPDPVYVRQRMVDYLRSLGISDPAVLTAMGRVPRHLFMPEALYMKAYEDTALPIGLGQTISQPSTVATMSQALCVRPGMRVLEIGTGSGYQAAVLACMGCTVFSIERVRELHRGTTMLLRSLAQMPAWQNLQLKNILTIFADGTIGLPDYAPFDRIIVTAGGPEVPAPLKAQLDDGGILLIPVGAQQRSQRLLRLTRHGDDLTTEDLGPAVFVDLVGDHGW